jgi:hypothetical protein
MHFHISGERAKKVGQLARALLDRGVTGTEVHRALGAAIADEAPLSSERLMRLLVGKGATVDRHIGTMMVKGDGLLLEILLEGITSINTTSK